MTLFKLKPWPVYGCRNLYNSKKWKESLEAVQNSTALIRKPRKGWL